MYTLRLVRAKWRCAGAAQVGAGADARWWPRELTESHRCKLPKHPAIRAWLGCTTSRVHVRLTGFSSSGVAVRIYHVAPVFAQHQRASLCPPLFTLLPPQCAMAWTPQHARTASTGGVS